MLIICRQLFINRIAESILQIRYEPNVWLYFLCAALYMFIFIRDTSSAEVIRANGVIKVNGASYELSFIDPEYPIDVMEDPRFCSGARICRWVNTLNNREIIHSQTVYPSQHSYGIPEEFLNILPIALEDTEIPEINKWPWPDLQSSPMVGLRIGVGYVWRHPTDVYKNRLAKGFKWNVDISHSGDDILIVFKQIAPKYYSLQRKAIINNYGEVIIQDEITNLSRQQLCTPVLLHPFFPTLAERRPWGILKNGAERTELPVDLINIYKKQNNNLPGENEWIVAGDDIPLLTLCANPAINALAFWRKDNSFSIEPIRDISVGIAQSLAWEWRMKTPCF
jgi:hypothetical protein